MFYLFENFYYLAKIKVCFEKVYNQNLTEQKRHSDPYLKTLMLDRFTVSQVILSKHTSKYNKQHENKKQNSGRCVNVTQWKLDRTEYTGKRQQVTR